MRVGGESVLVMGCIVQPLEATCQTGCTGHFDQCFVWHGADDYLSDPPTVAATLSRGTPAPYVSIRVYDPDTPLIVLNQQNTSLDQRLVVMIADHLVKHSRNITLISGDRGEKRWPKLNAHVLQRNS